jgi:hypothetical protein
MNLVAHLVSMLFLAECALAANDAASALPRASAAQHLAANVISASVLLIDDYVPLGV